MHYSFYIYSAGFGSVPEDPRQYCSMCTLYEQARMP